MVTYAICSAPDLLSSALSDYEEPPFFVSRSAKINVTPYLEARIEYQYPNEPLQTIFSTGGELSYSIEERQKQCSGIPYALEYQEAIISSGVWQGWQAPRLRYFVEPYRSDAPFSDFVLTANGIVINTRDNEKTPDNNYEGYLYHWSYNGGSSAPYTRSTKLYRANFNTANHFGVQVTLAISYGIRFLKFQALNNTPCLPDCVFTVSEKFFDSLGNLTRTEIRHQETREEVCPEVWRYPCELGEIQTYNVNLEPLEALFITTSSEFALQNGTLNEGFDLAEIINFLAGNPDNCILIWKLERNFGFFYSLTQIAQICSALGCPPPEYNYECLDSCRSCPPDTCAVECEDHICCYGSDGVVVESIPIGEYCNE